MAEFFRILLRTTDVTAARAFYTSVLPHAPDHVLPLHESALARGARPHWLGFLEVPDVEAACATFGALGGMALGPTWTNPEGIEAAVMRDPGGAIIALAKPPEGMATHVVGQPEVAWYALNTREPTRAEEYYRALAGWTFHAPVALAELGVARPFAFRGGDAPRGSFSDVEGREGVHAHWLFHFRVPELSRALDAVRAAGGKVLGPFTLPSGRRVAVCDDPQGAAFALTDAPA